MEWIFLLGIIVLAVYHEGFRKVLFWVLGIGAAVVAVFVAVVLILEKEGVIR